ncbi:hypothetical protein [Paractinoplanes hotanensis]|uniref:Transmembrane transport protein n=1 Tax=Paractinoplanes hotanensis TaxID=2906497 RepID=A0ABT0Y271_9ACTN|nr:hypothetical protein [Actinoplanes hotanensis]MCM4079940.1 hypothetical protein [Actinoplanes hotanensis]
MTPEDLLGRLDARLSFRRRIAYAAVAFAGLAGSALIGVLWATEPHLPPRTQVAFGVLVVIGAAWAVFGGWAVTRRMPLFARDRVVAGWLGLAAWTVFAVGAAVVAPTVPSWLIVIVCTLGVTAAANLALALRARATLLRRRAELTE